MSEFVLDLVMLRRIARAETEQASRDIAESGPLSAYRHSVLRHDQRLAAAADADTLACQSGCAWCCHFSVDVRPVEVFNIMQFVQVNFTAQQQQDLWREADSNRQLMAGLDEQQRMQQNLKCPFLSEQRCSIYAARPQTCRNYHATNAAGCRQSFEQPDNFDIAPDYAPMVYQAGGAHVEAFAKAMLDAGYDMRAYELNAALSAAVAAPSTSSARFAGKSCTFPQLLGTDVPFELTEFDT